MSIATGNGDELYLVEADSVSVEFRVSARGWRGSTQRLRAVDEVSLQIARGETLALVGESGCGKTTLGRTLLRLYDPVAGRVVFDGVDLATLKSARLLAFRRRAQMVFQDPYASLDPRMRVEQIVAEPLRAHGIGTSSERQAEVARLLELVGLPPRSARRYPHAFSGGQRQRIGIARALALAPEFVVADEPVSALDVSIQAAIVNLLRDLQESLGLTLLLISHDLAVVRHAATRIAVMYLGTIVELAPRDALFEAPLHPYTKSLLSAVPIPDPRAERSRERIVLSGDVPSPIDPPSGCLFHPRCPVAIPICATVRPRLRLAEGRAVACHLVHPPD
jgi:oligopeptide transport system ATP-binding protein